MSSEGPRLSTIFQVRRHGTLMEPLPGERQEAAGVLNPAAARGRDGELYIFPRIVEPPNFSRIGISRVLFNGAGDPIGVERLGFALEPEADYELRSDGGGCEDPRVTFVEPLDTYIMTYTAFSPIGPRIALAASYDLMKWERIGLAKFHEFYGVHFAGLDNKDALIFPQALPNVSCKPSFPIIHRPLFPETAIDKIDNHPEYRQMDLHRESLWISYSACAPQGTHCEDSLPHLRSFQEHHRLAAPVERWERIKVGGGTPPVLTRFGWLLLYHGVGREHNRLEYSAGLMILDKDQPQKIVFRSERPVLHINHKIADRVIFPTGMDQRTDIGQPDRFDIYFGVDDVRIGSASLRLPAELPAHAARDPHEGMV